MKKELLNGGVIKMFYYTYPEMECKILASTYEWLVSKGEVRTLKDLEIILNNPTIDIKTKQDIFNYLD